MPRTLRALLFSLSLCATAPVAAEPLVIEGLFPAPRAETMRATAIRLDRIDGNEGDRMADMLHDELGRIEIDRKPWFSLQSSRNSARADAVFAGYVNVAIEERAALSDQQCGRQIINISLSLRLNEGRGGRQLYSFNRPRREEISSCADRNDSVDELIDQTLRDAARAVAQDMTPAWKRQKVKILETRVSLPPSMDERFMRAIQLTRGDPRGACALFTELYREAPTYAPFAYDAGLCAEQEGRLRDALRLYEEARVYLFGERLVKEGVARVQGRLVAQEALDARSSSAGGWR